MMIAIDGGLSPRVRGSHLLAVASRHRDGSIPACAGEPTGTTLFVTYGRVYPRVCGGAQRVVVGRVELEGLSPRVRGSLSAYVELTRLSRSIPACAGEPGYIRLDGHLRQVYPRVCGGAAIPGKVSGTRSGLSPRVRGSRPYCRDQGGNNRSIPACAGEPSSLVSQRYSGRVYPRVCGGATNRSWPDLRDRGLSPRVRGSLMTSAFGTGLTRSIPACAGEPVLP